MVSFKCESCGGELSVAPNGDLVCEYCGRKSTFTDRDLAEYKQFRSRMLSYLRSMADSRRDSEGSRNSLWQGAETIHYTAADGADIAIKYIFTCSSGGVTMYLTRRSVIYIFPKAYASRAENMEKRTAEVAYPAADVRELNRCFPVLNGHFVLSDGSILLSVARRENLYPLAVFGRIEPVHAAWIISRMENICCVLEYSGLVHNGISEETVFIDTMTHEAALLGGWWGAGSLAKIGSDEADLSAVRRTALRVLGGSAAGLPAAFADFLGRSPQDDAYADFGEWDRVIDSAFGGRRFEKMDNI